MLVWVLVASLLAVLLAVVEGAVPAFDFSYNNTTQTAVGENVQMGRVIYRLTVTDADIGDTVTCTGAFTPPAGGAYNGDEFTFNTATTAGVFTIAVTDAPPRTTTPLDTGSYECDVTCTDTSANSRSVTITIDSKPSQVLYWDPLVLPATLNAALSSNNYKTLDPIATKTAQNALNLNMEYFLDSVTPDLSGINGQPFFTVGQSSGTITLLQDLLGVPKDVTPDSQIHLGIKAVSADGITNTEIFTIQMSNQKSRPYILELPATINVPEHTTSIADLLNFNISDPDATSLLQTLNYNTSMNCNPAEGNLLFTIDSGTTRRFHIKDGWSLNYEKTQIYNCTIIVNDGLHDSLVEYIEIYVTDENDACVFDKAIYTAVMVEGGKGAGTADPGFNVTDEDGHTLSYSFTGANDSHLFAIDNSRILTFNEPYELDGTNAYPSEVWLTVVASDNGDNIVGNEKSCTAQVKITIVDANDNAPVCNGGYTTQLTSSNTMTGGSTIGSLNPTDADSSTANNVVTCTQTSATGTAASFYKVNSNGDVSLEKEIYSDGTAQLSPGASAQYKVLCSDNGSPTQSTECILDVVYVYVDTTTTTAATTTTTEKNFFDFPAAIALAVLLGLLGLGLLALGLYFCLRYCCCKGSTFCDCGGRCCDRKQPHRRITPETLPRRERTPRMVRKQYVQPQPQQVQVVRTIAARPTYGMRTMGTTMPMRTGAFPTYGGGPPAYFP